MATTKRLSQDRNLVFAKPKTNNADQNCQSTALTTAAFSFAKLDFGNQGQ